MRQTLLISLLLALSLGCVSAATLTGKIVGTNGKPIIGAHLNLFVYNERKMMNILSDAGGGFAVAVDLAHRQPDRPLGNITVYAPGYALCSSQLNETGNVITLSPGTTLSGTVVDAAGKPLAGISISLRSWRSRENSGGGVPWGLRKQFTVATTADGGWTLPDIPREGEVTLSLDDEHYAREDKEITLVAGEQAEPVQFTAYAGGTLSGRVLSPQGTPATNVWMRVDAAQRNGNSAAGVTAADGSYHFTKLLAGTYTISVFSDKQPWIADTLNDITLAEGKETVVPDLQMQAGAVLDGTVVDAATGTPLSAAFISLSLGKKINDNSARTMARTDESGHFHFCLQPAAWTLLCTDAPSDYLSQSDGQAQTVNLQIGKPVTVTVKLHKGRTVTGTVTDEKGKPVAGVMCYIEMRTGVGALSRFNPRVTFTTDKYGHFTATGLPVGKGSVVLPQRYDTVNKWELPGSLTIDVPAKRPISIKVTHSALHYVSGRVVDTQHHPLAGVTATFSEAFSRGPAPRPLTAITGAAGSYRLTNIPAHATVTLLSLDKAGYRWRSTRVQSNTGGSATLPDAVMAACTAAISGKVCDAEGKAVPGATVVSVEGGLAARAITDAAGAFTLAQQPAGELHLVAATATSGGLTTCAENAPALITCTPGVVAAPADIALARRLLEADSKLPKTQRRFNRADTLHPIADIDVEQAKQLAQDGTEPLPEGLRAYLLAKEAEHDPANVDLVQLNLLQNPDCKLYAAVEVGIAEMKNDPGLAEQLYEIARPLFDENKHYVYRYINIEGLGTFPDISLRTIALAGLLQKTADVDAMLDKLSPLLSASPAWAQNQLLMALFEAAARVSPEFVASVYHRFNGVQGNRSPWVLMSTTPHDPAAAQRLFKAMQQLNVLDASRYSVDFTALIKALGKADPAAALALAKMQSADMRPTALLAVALFQPKTEADAMLREVFSQECNLTIANIALANAVNPELARELYTKHKQHLEAEGFRVAPRSGDILSSADRAKYAYLISSIDPVEARLIVETAFADARNQFSRGESYYDMQFLATAMYALDVARAQQMLEALHVNKNFRQRLEQQLIQFILMPRADRVAAPLN